ncbi:hypothetical protein NFI96_011365 [Prochilodus magdalenae]|nr:hypothetical protein NFI96_011365 [Prochilodus magdalenae]
MTKETVSTQRAGSSRRTVCPVLSVYGCPGGGSVREQLSGESYDSERSAAVARTLSSRITDRLKDLGLERYKLVVQVVIGEQRGEGVQMASRCFWDADTDSCAKDIYMNDSLFCVAAVFGVYYY